MACPFAGAQHIEVIPKAGINFSRQAISDLDGERNMRGFQIGLAFDVQSAIPGLSVRPEINYITKGTTVKSGITRTSYRLNYLDIPVFAKLSFQPVYIVAGPSLGVLLNNQEKVAPAYGNLKSLDFGLQVGAGFRLPAGRSHIVIDGRYAFGIRDIADSGSRTIRNKGLQVSVGYPIPLNGR
ncbi:MAG: PorT family protein [Mucilaginibacter polytrichastri]|nr:PorT family protein [Mucilaginibacter polytrichastri]